MTTIMLPTLLQVVPARDGIAVAADVASIVIAVAVLVVVVMVGLLLARINRVLGEVRVGVRHNLGPVSERARSISDNVEFITQVVRSDVERLNESVRALSDKLTLASEHMEDRIEEFNMLMEVVQGEAEDLFVDTAATVRGVREGARTLAHPRPTDEPDGPASGDEPLEADAPVRGRVPAFPEDGDADAAGGI